MSMQAQEANMKTEIAMPAREKYWEERTEAEKIEVLREYVSHLEHAIQSISANTLNLLQHQHGEDGRLLAPLREVGSNQATIGGAGMSYGLSQRLKTKRERDRSW